MAKILERKEPTKGSEATTSGRPHHQGLERAYVFPKSEEKVGKKKGDDQGRGPYRALRERKNLLLHQEEGALRGRGGKEREKKELPTASSSTGPKI